jgi:hypothetical protein
MVAVWKPVAPSRYLMPEGKNRKVDLIAICKKLLKQAFVIVKSSQPYQANFTSKLTLNF